jgi:uncharacterized protein YgfB (UPF0149 family)
MAELDWDLSAAALASVRPWLSPAELHGLLCGSVCAEGGPLDDDRWLQRVWQHLGEDPAADADHGMLARFGTEGVASLLADDFAFAPLLPEDDAALDARLRALAGFCAGFLSGYGLGGGRVEGLEEDAVTALMDLAAIARVETDVAGAEQEEADFAELSEYVRMAVLVVLGARRTGEGDEPEPAA